MSESESPTPSAEAPSAAPPSSPPSDAERAPSGERPPSGDRGYGGGDRGGDRGGNRDERPRRRPGGGGRFGRRRVCSFCVDKVVSIDYKEASRLRRYISDRGKIEPRRKTGTCAKHQRMLTLALKRARHLALLPFTAQHIQLTGVFPSR